jgi:hypothetical protein
MEIISSNHGLLQFFYNFLHLAQINSILMIYIIPDFLLAKLVGQCSYFIDIEPKE